MSEPLALPLSPTICQSGHDLVIGTYHPQKLSDGGWTICRAIGLVKWFPLALGDAHQWLTWPSLGAAVQWMLADPDSLGEYPMWGR